MSEVDHAERIQLGIVAGCVFGFAYGVVDLVTRHPVEVAQGAGLIVAFFGSVYAAGYLVSKGIALTPFGRARPAEAARLEADRQYAETVPATMVVLDDATDGRYDASVCTLLGTETQLFPVGPGTLDEITLQAKEISDEHGANTLCIYRVDGKRSVTYEKIPSGEWTKRWKDDGSLGIGRLKKRAATNQRQHDKAASGGLRRPLLGNGDIKNV